MRKNEASSMGDQYIAEKHRRRNWKSIVAVLGCLVVIATVSGLTLPAITMNDIDCNMQEHQHSELCYADGDRQILSCTAESLEIHQHKKEEGCFDANGKLICHYADYVIHTHDERCRDENGNLVCTLPEVKEHKHNESCYRASASSAKETHQHDDNCYEWVRGDQLICEKTESAGHAHDNSCYASGNELICEKAESEGHTHQESCYDEDGNLICDQEESAGHHHESECYLQAGTLICEKEELEGHQHSDDCYEQIRGQLICTKQESAAEADAEERVLICSKPEVEAHTHKTDGSCFSTTAEKGTVWTCKKLEVKKHQHTDACFKPEQVLVCQLPEHVHGDDCVADGLLPEEEQQQADQVISMINELPDVEALTSELQAYDEERNLTGWEMAVNDARSQAQEVRAAYDALSELIRNAVSNADKLINLEQLLMEAKPPVMTEEEAAAVAAVQAMIDQLPDLEQLQADIENDEDAAATVSDVTAQIQEIHTAYDAFNDLQKRSVTNIEKVNELEKYLSNITELTEEEREQVDTVIALIEGLPEIQDAKDMMAKLESEKNEGELAVYQEKLKNAVKEASDGYNELSSIQKLAVVNAAKLDEYLEWLQAIGLMENNRYLAKQYTDATYTQLRDDPITIMVIGDLPEGAEVRAYPVEVTMGDVDMLCAYDISIFLPDGSIYQPETPVTVKFIGLAIDSQMDVVILHEDENEKIQWIPSQEEEDSVVFTAEHFSVYAAADAQELSSVAEPGDPEAMQQLVDSGFFTYWSDAAAQTESGTNGAKAPRRAAALANDALDKPSNEQVTNRGGENTSEDGSITVSKTIEGTETENVFDITLKVDTTQNISELQLDPDMAVVIVMDISNTMTEPFGDSTRYKAVMESAEEFLDKFAEVNKGYSKIGYVAFNTDAHEIFGLSSCSTTEEAIRLKNTMRQETGEIINADGYGESHSRFTNVEGGLKMARDMLANASNKNKYIIFLSDGFPTTYVSSGYNGYDPYTGSGTVGQDGVFYDDVDNKYCHYGTSYSDKAAIKAREMASGIKDSGITIFSIGIDVGGQTIAGYDTHRGQDYYSIIDRTSEKYELGSATDTDAFKNWLKNGIGSGYYYDSTNTEGLKAAYDQIFEELKSSIGNKNDLKWIASDPMPMGMENDEVSMEFIGFYDNKGDLLVYPPQEKLTGNSEENGENTVSYDKDKSAIAWDIRHSGFTKTVVDNSTTYHYTVTYRVRLKNELEGFVENQSYETNGKTTLTYQEIVVENGKETVSPDKTVEFPIPEVKGYLGDLTFKKVNQGKEPLEGAEFELNHDTDTCNVCRGDGKEPVEAMRDKSYTANSGADGIVTFKDLPSGHTYILKETKAPAGYQLSNTEYVVEIAYDTVSVKEKVENNEERQPWDLNNGNIPEVINYAGVILPNTGGTGTSSYMFSGLALIGAVTLIYSYRCKKRKEAR